MDTVISDSTPFLAFKEFVDRSGMRSVNTARRVVAESLAERALAWWVALAKLHTDPDSLSLFERKVVFLLQTYPSVGVFFFERLMTTTNVTPSYDAFDALAQLDVPLRATFSSLLSPSTLDSPPPLKTCIGAILYGFARSWFSSNVSCARLLAQVTSAFDDALVVVDAVLDLAAIDVRLNVVVIVARLLPPDAAARALFFRQLRGDVFARFCAHHHVGVEQWIVSVAELNVLLNNAVETWAPAHVRMLNVLLQRTDCVRGTLQSRRAFFAVVALALTNPAAPPANVEALLASLDPTLYSPGEVQHLHNRPSSLAALSLVCAAHPTL